MSGPGEDEPVGPTEPPAPPTDPVPAPEPLPPTDPVGPDATSPGVDLGKPADEPTSSSPVPPAYPPVYPAPPGYGGPPGYPPGYPPPGYPPGYEPPYPGGAKGPTSTLAVIAMVMGVASMVCCQIFGPVALYLGIRSRRQVRETGEDGENFALTGIISGGIATAILVVGATFYLMIAVIAMTSRSTPRTTFPPPISRTTFPRTSSSQAPGTGTRPGGGAAVPTATCVRLRSALNEFEQPATSSYDRLNRSAETLRAELGLASTEDVTIVLVDSVARIGQRGTGSTRPIAVMDALARLNDSVVALGCS